MLLSRESEETVKPRGTLLSTPEGLPSAKRKLERGKILLVEADRQLPVVASKYATSTQDTGKHGHLGRIKKASQEHFEVTSSPKYPGPIDPRRRVVIKGNNRPLALLEM